MVLFLFYKNAISYFKLYELGINNNTSSNTTYKPTSSDKDEILANNRSFMTSLNIPSGREWGFTLFILDT